MRPDLLNPLFAPVTSLTGIGPKLAPLYDRLLGDAQHPARIIDLLFIRKDSTGSIAKLTTSDLDWEEAADYGSYIGTLIGFGAGGVDGAERGSMAGAAELADGHVFDENDAFRLAQAVPEGTSIALALIEHTWALPLLDAVERAKGFEINNQWVSADTLVELGMRHAIMEEMEENE